MCQLVVVGADEGGVVTGAGNENASSGIAVVYAVAVIVPVGTCTRRITPSGERHIVPGSTPCVPGLGVVTRHRAATPAKVAVLDREVVLLPPLLEPVDGGLDRSFVEHFCRL